MRLGRASDANTARGTPKKRMHDRPTNRQRETETVRERRTERFETTVSRKGERNNIFEWFSDRDGAPDLHGLVKPRDCQHFLEFQPCFRTELASAAGIQFYAQV